MPKMNSLSEITIVLKTLCVNDFFTKLTKAGWEMIYTFYECPEQYTDNCFKNLKWNTF